MARRWMPGHRPVRVGSPAIQHRSATTVSPSPSPTATPRRRNPVDLTVLYANTAAGVRRAGRPAGLSTDRRIDFQVIRLRPEQPRITRRPIARRGWHAGPSRADFHANSYRRHPYTGSLPAGATFDPDTLANSPGRRTFAPGRDHIQSAFLATEIRSGFTGAAPLTATITVPITVLAAQVEPPVDSRRSRTSPIATGTPPAASMSPPPTRRAGQADPQPGERRRRATPVPSFITLDR